MNRITITILLMTAVAAVALSGCIGGPVDEELFGTATGGTLKDGEIKQAGSSTVYPLAERWAEEFGTARGIQILVGGGGSGKGASGLCAKELDLGDMSRTIKQAEIDDCKANGVNPVEWKVAFDGLSVVVSKKNTFVEDLSVDQLAQIFRAEDFATSWDQVDPSFPDQPIRLCYPGSDSGTYEYFNEEVLDKGDPRKGDGVQTSEDDNVLVTCLANDQYAIGYFGFAYVQENEDKIRAIKVNGVAPSFESIASGTYKPLGRPIYIYTNGVPTGILADYFSYVYHPEGGQSHVQDVGYVALDTATVQAMLSQLNG